MSVRFITSWNGHQPGDVATFSGPVEADLIAAGLARDASENDNAGAGDLQSQINAIGARLPTVVGDYANDPAAAAAGVDVGDQYHTGGAVKLRVA